VVDPPTTGSETVVTTKRKRGKKVQGGIEEWFVNTVNDEPGIDDS
jgi:hypothetical protein